ncbi:MAG: hypothetical protein V8T45_11105 [Oscillospiraceae bacterium]
MSAILVVYISTMASVNVKLNDKCYNVTDGFYSGVSTKAEWLSRRDSVKELCSAFDELQSSLQITA